MLVQVIRYIWLFFIYAFLGWTVEVIYSTCARGGFENRGFLNGPLCPIYGFGVVAVVLCLQPLKGNLLLLFLGSVLVTSALELVTGFLMEKIFHHRWWDYSNMPMNIGGYVCMAFSLVWGLACVFLITVIQPSVDFFVAHIPNLFSYIALPLLTVTFVIDSISTATAVFHFNRKLEEIEKIAAQIHQMSDDIGKRISSSASKVYTSDKMQKLKSEVQEHKESLENLKARLNDKINSMNYMQKRLVKAFPTMRSIKHAEALRKVKEALKTKRD
ncbi:MAG: hypothetical protein MJ057_06140 [Sphaerochaetaceae bacterium]|nr:hypothetical protein [Sphaerochaetaceae bacterium]